MVPKIGRRKRAGALSSKDSASAGGVEQEAGIGNRVDRKAEDVAVKRAGFLQVRDGDDEAGFGDGRHL